MIIRIEVYCSINDKKFFIESKDIELEIRGVYLGNCVKGYFRFFCPYCKFTHEEQVPFICGVG